VIAYNVIPQSLLACDGFASSLQQISRHLRPGPYGTPCGSRVIFRNRAGIELTRT